MDPITANGRYRLTSPIPEALSRDACSPLTWHPKVLIRLTPAPARRLPDRHGALSANLLTTNNSRRCLLSVEAACRPWPSGRLCRGHNHLTQLRRQPHLALDMRHPQRPPQQRLFRCPWSQFLARPRPQKCTRLRRRRACADSRRRRNAKLRQSGLARRRRSLPNGSAASRQQRPSRLRRVSLPRPRLPRDYPGSRRLRPVLAMREVLL